MKKKEEYENIKTILLKDENIEKVVLDIGREEIRVTPNQERDYNWLEGPLESFRENGRIKISNKIFNIVKCCGNMGKIYELVLREY